MSQTSPAWQQFTTHHVLPHAGQMILLDEILDFVPEGSILCGVTVGTWSLFHNETGLLPAFVGLEFMAQTVSAYFGMLRRLAGEPLEVGFLLGTRRMSVNLDAFQPGQQLTVEANKVYDYNGMGVFDCSITEKAPHSRKNTALMRGKVNVYRPEDLTSYLAQQANDET